MTKKKTLVAEIDLKVVYAELVPARKEGRSPKQVGQGRSKKHIRLHGITLDELKNRMDNAKSVLETGKIPGKPKKETPAPPPPTAEDVEKNDIQEFLRINGVEFNPQLGLKKLKALKEKFMKSLPQTPATDPVEPEEKPLPEESTTTLPVGEGDDTVVGADSGDPPTAE